MSGAIERDDEVAAKATPGEWRLFVAGPDAHNLANAIYADPAPATDSPDDEDAGGFVADCLPEWVLHLSHADNYPANAEHILRLHNRYPKYRALAEAVRNGMNEAWGFASSTCSEFCVHSMDKPERCPMNSPELRAIDGALAALDAEDEQGGER